MNFKLKHVFLNDIIIYKNDNVTNILTIIVIEFKDVFTNFKNIINLLSIRLINYKIFIKFIINDIFIINDTIMSIM